MKGSCRNAGLRLTFFRDQERSPICAAEALDSNLILHTFKMAGITRSRRNPP